MASGSASPLDTIVALGPDPWHALCVLRLLADENGVVRMDKHEIAMKMRVTVQTLNKRLSALKEYAAVDSIGHIHVSQAPQGVETFLTLVLEKLDSSSLNAPKNTGVKIDADTVIRHFMERYKAKYHESARIKWYIARNSANQFIRRHGERSLDVIDAAFANFDTTWRNAANPRLSFVAMMTWVGEQSAAFVEEKRDGAKVNVEEAY